MSDHLSAVARRAAEFAGAFGAGVLAQAAGWWHDLGKATPAFQEKVLARDIDEADTDADDTREGGSPPDKLRARQRVDHSTAGARHALDNLGPIWGTAIAYAIAGHHGRLPNHAGTGKGGTLTERLDPRSRRIEPLDPGFDPADPFHGRPPAPTDFTIVGPDQPKTRAFQMALLIRMIYSVLIDADRLETERFCDQAHAAQRPANPPAPAQLLDRLDRHLEEFRASRSGKPAPVDRHRDAVLSACRDKAHLPPGLFSLTVPTGGGKTFASLAFALTHAKHHQLRRVVYALPYTSIIEQTAESFRRVLGERHVLEHHSNLDQETRARRSMTQQMASENFDAPVIVTTNTQLFESLFSAHGSTCRKLHRLARSVIVLDEAQTIPPRVLKPTLALLEELARNYACTVLLCTATQPALTRRPDFPIGLNQPTEIVPDPTSLYLAMQRVRVQHLGDLDDDALVARLAQHDQTLCIVNTRQHAAELTTRLTTQLQDSAHDDPGPVVHLSAAMCPQHRSERVAQIKKALKNEQPIRVISTQVIEAGVDVDFPVVYRALAGFDSIAQAAGRCNREGLADQGQVYLFETHHPPARSLICDQQTARELIKKHPDPLALDAIDAYFQLVYWKRQHEGAKPWDHRDVMGCFETPARHQFRDADERFNWIDSQTTPVIVPHGQAGQDLIQHLTTADAPDWTRLRTAQRYCVSVYDNQMKQLQDNTTVTPCFDGRFWVLNNPDAYDPLLGLRFDVEGWDAAAMFV